MSRRMRDFMKGGLFCLFIVGLGLCALSLMSGVVVILVEVPLFSTRQFEELFGVGVAFCTGMTTCFLSALGSAAVDFGHRRENPPSVPEFEAEAGD
jgi:hypothetical protein